MAAYSIHGGCLCGAARYRLAAAPLSTSTCHCRTCRRAAGAEQVSWATVRDADFGWETSPPATYASSPGVERSFCAVCGTGLTFRDAPETIDVALATLDDPEACPPARETWLSHRLAWNPPNPALPGRAEGWG